MDKRRFNKGNRNMRNRVQDKLTVKQEAFVKKYTDSSNRETFLKVRNSFCATTGKDPKSAYGNVGGYMMMKKPHVKAAIIEALHKVKITPEYQAKKLKELMESNNAVWHEGVRVGTEPDNRTRHQALVTSLKITDALNDLEDSMNPGGMQINIGPELAERLIKIAAEMRQMREQHSSQVIPLIPIKDTSNVK